MASHLFKIIGLHREVACFVHAELAICVTFNSQHFNLSELLTVLYGIVVLFVLSQEVSPKACRLCDTASQFAESV